MAEPSTVQPAMTPEDRLQRRIDEMWQEMDRFIAEGGDPDEAFDRMVEEEFGTPEVQQALLDWVLEDIFGKGWNDDSVDDEQPE